MKPWRLFYRDFMDADMDRTKVIICYLRPLLRLESRTLERFIHKSVVHTVLWYILTYDSYIHRKLILGKLKIPL